MSKNGNKKGPVIMVTGHRPSKLDNRYGYDLNSDSWQAVKEAFKEYVKHENASEVITGMALGTDTIAALAVRELKEEGYPIKLTCAIPYHGQEQRWYKDSKDLYYKIIEEADNNPDDLVHYVTLEDCSDRNKAIEALMNRNTWMIDRCDKAFAFYDESVKSGTADAIEKLKNLGKEYEIFNPYRPDTWVTNHYDEENYGKTHIETKDEIVFKDNDSTYSCLCNDIYMPFFLEKIKYNCAESAYQAQKLNQTALRYDFGTKSAKEALEDIKTFTVGLSEGWDAKKHSALKTVMLAKFNQNKKALNVLMNTGSKKLVFERSDGFISDSSDEMLAEVLMEIRDEKQVEMRLEKTEDVLENVTPSDDEDVEVEEKTKEINENDFMDVSDLDESEIPFV